MGVVITAEINGDKQLSVELGIAATAIRDWRKPLQESATELLKSFQLNFDSRGNQFGGWAARKRNYPWPLLEKTGRLRHGFTGNVTGNEAVLTNTVPYFGFHQLGTSKLPARVMLKVDQARQDYIVKAFQRHIVESTQGLG